ncbi:hypothetical protein FLA4_08360 [Candidatus Rickettsia kotlanii]|nr:hypothetical protein FLA4_08360 [Candidatus Rickettsia kotlanii]BDU61669.1 hypothetical protein HM2_08370 [Candidatus Rickettsia kotlanii]
MTNEQQINNANQFTITIAYSYKMNKLEFLLQTKNINLSSYYCYTGVNNDLIMGIIYYDTRSQY